MSAALLDRPTTVAIGTLDQIPPGEGRNFQVGATRIAVFRTRAGAVYATQPRCPHQGGPLADGMLGAKTLVCPLHDRAFDLETGQELTGPCHLKTYPITTTASGTLLLTLPPTN